MQFTATRQVALNLQNVFGGPEKGRLLKSNITVVFLDQL